MSNYDKIVKGACKPKNQNPKAKYVDQLVSATYSNDGSLNDIIRSLSLRLREPNAVVVFKALLTLHQMIRQGSTDQLMEHLAGGDSLRLRNVGNGNWEGYTPPSSMKHYASYLDARIRAWRDLKHDLVRIQSESNRRSDGLGAASKARRLRHLSVDKGLLREVQQVQKVLDALLQCKFYDDDLKDENTVLAFRMLVKDVLVLFQAGNEGVCNILEHYFEMSKIDAKDSFDIYKSFISQTDRVVDYLGVARKLQNVVNVPVPNLKHAPTSLVKALEEYLNDPNFEQNRLEYKKSLGVVEGRGGRTPSPNPETKKEESKPKVDTTTSSTSNANGSSSQPASATSPVANAPPGASKKIQDFFDSIQTDQQPTMFGGPAQQLNYGSMNAAFNPFRQSTMMPQATGFGMMPQMTGFPGQMPSQAAGAGQFGQMPGMPNQFAQPGGQSFIQPQATGMFGQPQSGPTPFHQPQPLQGQAPGFMQQQQPGFLQPQSTGSNPFRQSTMFGGAGSAPPMPGSLALNTTAQGQSQPHGFSQPSSPFHISPQAQMSGLNRPGSTPAGGAGALQPQATGTKNPFAPAQPAGMQQQQQQERGPSMNELAWTKQFGAAGGVGGFGSGAGAGAGAGAGGGGMNGFGFSAPSPGPFGAGAGAGQNGANVPGGQTAGSGMSDIASAFASSSPGPGSGPGGANGTGSGGTGGIDDFLAQFGSMSTSSSQSQSQSQSPSTSSSAFGGLAGAFSPQSTGQTSAFSSGSGSASAGASGFLQPQQTGFGGSNIKRFQPTSSFGRQAMESLAPISEGGGGASQGGGGGGGGDQGQGQGQNGFFGGVSGAGAGGGAGGTTHSPVSATSTSTPFQPFGQGSGGNAFGAGPFGSGMGSAFGSHSQPQSQPQPGAGAGAGAPNPFRQSSMPAFGGGAFGQAPQHQPQQQPPFGGAFGGGGGGQFGFGQAQQQGQGQGQGQGSLI